LKFQDRVTFNGRSLDEFAGFTEIRLKKPSILILSTFNELTELQEYRKKIITDISIKTGMVRIPFTPVSFDSMIAHGFF